MNPFTPEQAVAAAQLGIRHVMHDDYFSRPLAEIRHPIHRTICVECP
jgi:hypothetical protein